MTVLLNLKDRPLKALACGNCQGSSSDNTVRTIPREEESAVTTQPVQNAAAI